MLLLNLCRASGIVKMINSPVLLFQYWLYIIVNKVMCTLLPQRFAMAARDVALVIKIAVITKIFFSEHNSVVICGDQIEAVGIVSKVNLKFDFIGSFSSFVEQGINSALRYRHL